MLREINLQYFAEETGVEGAAVAGQELTAENTTEGMAQETTGEANLEGLTGNETGTDPDVGANQQPVAEADKVEKAFAARLAKEREKIEAEARQKAVDAWIASQGYVWNGKPITTEAEYRQALYEKELQEKGQDPSLIKKLIDEHPEVRAARELREKAQAEERQRREFQEFLAAYPDVKAEDIPMEVWQQNANGVPLKYAYADYALKQLKVEQAKANANAKNAASSTGSVSSDGNAGEEYFTKEQVARMSPDEVERNLDKIHKSMARW